MLRITSTRTGYLYPDMPGNERLRSWSDIEKERDNLRMEARQKGTRIAEANGHEMKPWSNINSSHCEKCGRQARIRNIFGRDNTEFKGPAFETPCDETTTYGSRDRWHWEFSAQME